MLVFVHLTPEGKVLDVYIVKERQRDTERLTGWRTKSAKLLYSDVLLVSIGAAMN